MAETMTKNTVELDEIALRIYAARVAAHPGVGSESAAIRCYRDAESFLSARAKVRSGALEITPPVGPQLADCFMPNGLPTHPHNLVSTTAQLTIPLPEV